MKQKEAESKSRYNFPQLLFIMLLIMLLRKSTLSFPIQLSRGVLPRYVPAPD